MELKEIIHYYIGQECKITSLKSGYNWVGNQLTKIDYHICSLCIEGMWDVKPILRMINSLTDEECLKLASFVVFEPHFINPFIIRNDFGDRIVYWGIKDDEIERVSEIDKFNADAELVWCAEQFHYLLSIGIDLFGLIDNNHAIDKATL